MYLFDELLLFILTVSKMKIKIILQILPLILVYNGTFYFFKDNLMMEKYTLISISQSFYPN